MTVLIDGIFNTRDVQPADDHAKELERQIEREGSRVYRGRKLEWVLLICPKCLLVSLKCILKKEINVSLSEHYI